MAESATRSIPKAEAGASSALTSEATKAPAGFLYHGTAKGNNFREFDLGLANSGNQGKAIYLTDSPDIANYHSYHAEMSAIDKKTGKSPRMADSKGSTLQISIDPNAKIKTLDHTPSPQEVENIKKEGFDGIKFADDVVREDWNTKIMGPYPKSKVHNTTLIFDPKKVQSISPYEALAEKTAD